MEFYYLDESGDNGAKGSKYLVLALLVISQKKKATQIIRRAKQRLLRKNKCAKWLNQNGGEIKFRGFPDKYLLGKMLEEIAELEGEVIYVPYLKEGRKIDLEEKEIIMPLLFASVLRAKKQIPEKVIADLGFFGERSMCFGLTDFGFNEPDDESGKKTKTIYIEVESTNEKVKNSKIPFIEVKQQNSRLCEELQLVDLVSGAIFQKFEHSNPEYFDRLNGKKLKLRLAFKREKK